jgi:thiol-disulfide isomerase/thioredoxin
VRTVAAAIVLLLAATSACSSSHAVAPGPHPNPNVKALIETADLDPCPPSSTTPVAGGLPDITVPCLGDGPAVHMAGITGKPLVVNIWGSWCPPCQAEEAYLSQAYRADRTSVRFLGVDIVDQQDSALDFDAHVSPPVRFPSVFDVDRKVALALHVVSPPFTALVSSTGKIVHTQHGAYTSTAELQKDIATYLHVHP